MTERTLRGRAAVIGVGESAYYRHGKSPVPEFVLALHAILAACEDAGIRPQEIDGFSSYSNDRNGPVRLAAALDIEELRYATMHWEGGGGGMAAAVGNAATAVATGVANCVVAFRGLAQGEVGRFGQALRSRGKVWGSQAYTSPYGVGSPGQFFAFKYTRWLHEHGGVGMAAQKAVSLASYFHAQQNPRAVMHGRPLTSEAYDDSRMIVEPWRLYDFCQENDGAAAIIVTTPERAKDGPHRPVYVLAAAQGANRGWGRSIMNSPTYPTANFGLMAPRLWEMAQVSPADVDVVQAYENFTGAVVMSLVEHGICEAEAVDEVLTFENLTAPSGRWPLNTSGGNLAEAYVHGLNLAIEGVRQLRLESVNQVPDPKVCLVAGGPMTAPISDLVFGTADTL
jgi:acetyl-CoA acetyltransferase